MEARPEPMKVEAGQQWGRYTVMEVCHDPQCSREDCGGKKRKQPHVHIAYDGKTVVGWDPLAHFGVDSMHKFKGYAPGTGPQAPTGERDWSKWLPPGPLPDTGPKVFKVGQIWACRDSEVDPPRVSVVDGADAEGNCQGTSILAGRPGWNPMRDAPYALHAVLVQDVGQPEPTPPEVLYAPRPRTEAPVRPEGAGPGQWTCVKCGSSNRDDVSRWHCSRGDWCSKVAAPAKPPTPDELRRMVTAQGETAFQVLAAKERARVERAEAATAFLATLADEFDRLPDATRGWR